MKAQHGIEVRAEERGVRLNQVAVSRVEQEPDSVLGRGLLEPSEPDDRILEPWTIFDARSSRRVG